ncbi:putative heme binding protein, partial [Trypoxylus dichotomus]
MKWILQHWKRKNVPFLEPSFPFGNLENPLTSQKSLPVHFQDFYKEFKRMGVKCGGIYQFCAPILMVMDPATIRLIMTKEFNYFHDRGFYNDGGIGSNLFTMDGDQWKILRAKFSPTFTS